MPSRTSVATRFSPADRTLTAAQALALGALQGPSELLPVSSSAHTSAAAWLLDWRYDELEPELRKAFEVALHAGTALALLTSLRGPIPNRGSALLVGLASAPPSIVGYVLEEEIEGRLGRPATIVAGLLAGSVAMTLADRCPQERRRRDARPSDGLFLGLAQACALVPGISRAGATRSAARWLGFYRADARLLSDEVGLPVLTGAGLLKAVRLCRRGLEPQLVPAFVLGATASYGSTLVCVRLSEYRGVPVRLLPYAVYRAALAGLLLMRLRRACPACRRSPAVP